jgi:hypothetical protein
MKRALILSIFILAFSSLCFAQDANIGQKIIGLWLDNEEEYWLFGSDGKLLIDGEQFKYSFNDTQQLVIFLGDDDLAVNFSMSSDGKTATLSLLGDSIKLRKMVYNTPVSLREGKWVNGSITSSKGIIAYTLNVERGKTYYIWTNDDSEGDGSKSLDINFIIFNENDVYNYDEDDDCWDAPLKFTASVNGKVTILVFPYDEDESGTFAIAYSNAPKRP